MVLVEDTLVSLIRCMGAVAPAVASLEAIDLGLLQVNKWRGKASLVVVGGLRVTTYKDFSKPDPHT